uniref:Abi family protein n=1 Tax=Marinomonas sp. (strain MWYL1) TaxID=400668 RepID=A6VRX3_MARMS
MPNTINNQSALINQLISNKRLESYKAVFHCSNEAELIGAYLWNIEVCSALFPLLTSAEVTLRNSIDHALTQSFGRFWWRKGRLRYNSYAPDKEPPFSVSAITNNFSKATNQVKRDKQARYNIANVRPLHQEIIAKTEFSTWEFILDNEFMGDELIWPAQLGKVFQGKWPSTSAASMLSSTKDLVKTVREFRNRVSHNEPIWKRYGVGSQEDSIAHLHEKIDRIYKLILLISPRKAELVKEQNFLSSAMRVCSTNEITICQNKAKTHNIDSIKELRHAMMEATAQNHTIIIETSEAPHCKLIPLRY